jgi:hypothetical protein
MRRTLPLAFALAGCATAPPLVSSAGPLPGPAYAVVGDTPAATEVRRQLAVSGRLADRAAVTIRTGFAAAPRASGSCAAPTPTGCDAWLDPPQTGWAPFALPLRYRLTLVLDGAETATVTAVAGGSEQKPPLAALVTAALAVLPAGSPATTR